MSIFVSFSMYFLSFVPLWITVLFINIKSLIDGGGDKWTEIISITGILLGLLVSLIILFVKFFVIDDEKYVLSIQEAKESKTITAEFLLSYILPLFAFDFTQWDEVVKFLIFFLIFGFLCIRHNYFSVNIILEILHYRMYECSLMNPDGKEVERTVISKNILSASRGRFIQVKILNNEYYLDIFEKKRGN
ncbi:MAG: hypothetical protein IKP92_03445 [Lachnospiraceae bacterium]|nr:hypothetical protein [Lachnospiraceae bacterium]